jgi:hypothetical protein
MIVRMRNSRLNALMMVPIVGIALALLLAGCAEVNYLRDAQSSFNEAARLENQSRMAQTVTFASAPGVGNEDIIRAGYANAVFSINCLNSKQIESLKSDKLWGVALTIKALSYWRLGNYDKDKEGNYDKVGQVITEANALSGDQLYPRDRAIMKALPGLLQIDEAWTLIFAKTKEMTPEAKKQRLSGEGGVVPLLDNAIVTLDKVRSSADNPEVQGYITQAILSSYRNKMTAYKVLAGGTYSSAEKKKAESEVTELDCSFKKYLNDTELTDARRQVIEPWKARLGFPDKNLDCKQ